jgi:hypothetical protein
MEALYEYYQENNSWYLPETEEPQYVPILGIRTNLKNEPCDIFKEHIGKLTFFEFCDLCLRMLKNCKKFGTNFKETKKLLKFEDDYDMDYKYYQKYKEVVDIINDRRIRSTKRLEELKNNKDTNNSNNPFVSFGKSMKIKFKEEKTKMESGWYIEFMRLYMTVIQIYLSNKYKILIENHPYILIWIAPLSGLAHTTELLNEYLDITKSEEFINGTYDVLIDKILPKYVLPIYLQSFQFMLFLNYKISDNLFVGYYTTKLLKEQEYLNDVIEKIWNNHHLTVNDLFTSFEYDKELFNIIEDYFLNKEKSIARETDKVPEKYRAANYGVWVYSGYFYYLTKHDNFNILQLISTSTETDAIGALANLLGSEMFENLLKTEKTNKWKLLSEHPHYKKINEFFHPWDNVTYMV